MKRIIKQLHDIGVIPVVAIDDAFKAVSMAKALSAGGLPAAEITFRTDAAEEAVRTIARELPNMLLLAGTILDVETARRAVEAGASAIVSPGTNPEVVEWCLAREIPVLPGCATPTEAESCMRMGLSVVKLFPAEAIGGVKLLKAMAGPYAKLRFMPTGGISPENLREYLALSNVLCCGGSWLTPKDKLASGDFAGIEALAREAHALVREADR